jgi:YfiR/HmsC-like
VALLNRVRAALCAVLLAALAPLSMAQQSQPEYELKAAILVKFLKFVEWPSTSAPGSAWVFCVASPDPFGDRLDNTVEGQKVDGRPIHVQRFTRLTDARGCQVLFISQAAQARIGVPTLPGVLTVGETPDFIHEGGLLRFYLKDNTVHFEISAERARAAGLHISAQLLQLGSAR